MEATVGLGLSDKYVGRESYYEESTGIRVELTEYYLSGASWMKRTGYIYPLGMIISSVLG